MMPDHLSDDRPTRHWRPDLGHALLISSLLLVLYGYWFAVADRYRLFLYYHDMGPLVPDTSPFSPVTASRYWMTGLVAGGAVMVLYTVANGLYARLGTQDNRPYSPPPWWRVWLLGAPALLVGIPFILFTQNEPTLPLSWTLATTAALLVALALALQPARLAVISFPALFYLLADGLGLMMVAQSLLALERLGGWLERGIVQNLALAAVALLAGLTLLAFMTAIRTWLRRPPDPTLVFYLAFLLVAYLLMPLIHHFFFTDGYYYISDRANFFVGSPLLQALIWILVGLLAFLTNQVRGALWRRRQGMVRTGSTVDMV